VVEPGGRQPDRAEHRGGQQQDEGEDIAGGRHAPTVPAGPPRGSDAPPGNGNGPAPYRVGGRMGRGRSADADEGAVAPVAGALGGVSWGGAGGGERVGRGRGGPLDRLDAG